MTLTYQSLGAQEAKDQIRARSGPDLSSLEVAKRRDAPPAATPGSTVRFEEDAHLAGVLGRMTGLLAADYTPGAPLFGEDPRGYAKTPHLVVDDLMARRATVRAEDVARAVAAVALAPDSFARLFRAAMQHPDLITLTDDGPDGAGRIYSTRAQVTLELEVMDRAVRLGFDSARRHDMVDGNILRAIIKERKLTREQGDAIRLAACGQRLTIISGRSGAGKTYVANVLADVHTRGGYKVFAVSPTGVGVDNLRAEGAVRAMTLAGLEHGVGAGLIKLDANSVILLDEAGQVGAKTADRLLEMVDASGAKLIALRDNDQLGPYEASPVFQTLEARIGTVELGTSQRQSDEAMRIMVQQLRSHHQADFAVKNMADAGVLKPAGTRTRAIEQLASDFIADKQADKIVLAHSQRDVAAINVAIRARMDQYMPARAAFCGGPEKAGTVFALRPGDKIALTSWYARAHLRPGTVAVVERRKKNRIVLRVGSGEEAEFISFKKDDPAFAYRFAFASTVHGAKGRAAASVHMLASPGMSRGILYTGAALHRDQLNIVVPVPKDRVIPVVTAIARTDDSARSALDYGFDATAHAKAVFKDARAPDTPAPGLLVDAADRTLDWIADRLDGGENGKRAVRPTQRRFAHLRDAVMVELVAAYRSDQGEVLGLKARLALEPRIEALISPRGWRRFVGQGWAVRAFETQNERGHIPGVSRQDQMVNRLLKRGVIMAEATNEEGLRDWFARAQTGVAAEIDAQAQAYAPTKTPPPTSTQTPAPTPAQGPVQKGPALQISTHPAAPETVDISVVRNRDYAGLGLQLAQAISERIPRRDPVHNLDLPLKLEALLRDADPGARFPMRDAALLARVPTAPYVDQEMNDLSKIVGTALAEGPPDDLDTLRAERTAILSHLDAPGEVRFGAKEFVPRLRSFTHIEVYALHAPQIAWPGSLPARNAAARATISKSFRAYADAFEKETKMQDAERINDIRDGLLKKLALGKIDDQSLDQIEKTFSLDEIMALRDPKLDMPSSLPPFNPAIRTMIAETLQRAAKGEQAGSGGAGAGEIAAKTAPEMTLDIPQEPPLSPEAARRRDLALSFSSAISRHITTYDPVHKYDVEKRIYTLLENAPRTGQPARDPAEIAKNILVARRLTQARRDVFAEMGGAHKTDMLLYGNETHAFLIARQHKEEFDERVSAALGKKPSSQELTPSDYDVAAAELMSRATTEPELVEAIGKALSFGVPDSGAELRAARARQIETLTTQKGLAGQNAETYAKSLFAAFSHKEMEALLKESEPLPETLPKLEASQRAAISQTLMAVFSRVQARDAPSFEKARALHQAQARQLGLNRGPSHGGPEL